MVPQSGIIPFSTVDNDDLGVITETSDYASFTIPSGVSKARFYFKGNLSGGYNNASKPARIFLYKNGASEAEPAGVSGTPGSSNFKMEITGGFVSNVLPCNQGDVYTVYASLQDFSSSYAAYVSAGSIFGIEVFE